MFEYHTLLIKMAINTPTIAFAKCNLCLLTNVKTLLGLNTIMPLLAGSPFIDQIFPTIWIKWGHLVLWQDMCMKRLWQFLNQKCTKVVNQVITKLQYQFPTQVLMDAFGVVYPKYWLQLKLEVKFVIQSTILKATFC